MAKKKLTTAMRRAAAKASWARRRAAEKPENQPAIANPDAPVNVTHALVPGYATLYTELMSAYDQSSAGKGKVRHANGRPFDRQPIMELTRLYGPGFAAGQAAKKTQEALGMLSRGEKDAALAEVHGAIVYLAATAAFIRG